MRLPIRPSAVLPLLALLTAVPAWGHSAVEPVPRGEEGWKRRHASMNEKAKELGGKAQVIFIGDSITQGWEGEGKAVWARYYAHRNAINLGIGGDRTQHVLWRLANGNLDGVRPKAAVLMIGTNNSNGEDNTVEQIADGVTAIVRRLREALPDTRILLLPIFPRSENPSPQRGKVLQVNQILQKLADERDIFWIDFGHRFLRPDGTIPRDLMPDYLHLSPKAYALWAASIETRLSAVLGDAAVTPEGEGASSEASGISVGGDWTVTIPGPNQEPVDLGMSLRQDGETLTGTVDRPGGGKLSLEKGTLKGGELSWTLRRERPDGGTMVYTMTGRVEGAGLVGKASTEFNGQTMTIDWKAKRR